MTIDNLDVSSIMTVVSFVTFLGILVWTFIMHRGSDFDTVARAPFADEEDLEQKGDRHV